MNKEQREALVKQLVEEITKDHQNVDKIKHLTGQLGISYSDEPMQLLNNVLKGIHFEGTKNESNV